MKKILCIAFLVLAFVSVSMAHDVTINVTKSLDDPTPRSSVFPASMSPIFIGYVVEQNGSLLQQTCAPGCDYLTITDLTDGSYTYRMGASVQVTRSDGTQVLTYGWSGPISVTVNCGVPTPDAPELLNASQVCK